MNILIIGSRVPWPLNDGGAIATYNMLKQLSASGLQIDFLTLNTLKHFADDEVISREFSFMNSIRTYTIDTSVKPVKAILNIFSGESYNISRFYDKNFEKLIHDALASVHYDLIHFEGLYTSPYALSAQISIPKILRQHNTEYKIWELLASKTGNPVKKAYLNMLAARLRKYESKAIHAFETVVCITEEDALVCKEEFHYQGLLYSVPPGLEVPDKTEVAEDPRAVYHIGSMEWLPNVDAMLWFHDRIWPLVLKSEPEARFYMAGKNMPASFLSMNSASFSVQGEVSDRKEFENGKTILVVPLRSGSGIRIKTIEAMMAGKAVVSTRTGARGLRVQNGEECLIADDPEEFAAAIVSLMQDAVKRDHIKDAGRKYAVSHFGSNAVVNSWTDLYKRTCLEFRKIDQTGEFS